MQTTINIIVLLAVLVLWVAYRREVNDLKSLNDLNARTCDSLRDAKKGLIKIQIALHGVLFESNIENAKVKRSNAALKGVITRMKNKAKG